MAVASMASLLYLMVSGTLHQKHLFVSRSNSHTVDRINNSLLFSEGRGRVEGEA